MAKIDLTMSFQGTCKSAIAPHEGSCWPILSCAGLGGPLAMYGLLCESIVLHPCNGDLNM